MTGRNLLIAVFLIVSTSLFGQKHLTLERDGKLKETESVLSDVILIIPKGDRVEVISGPNKGVYKVNYKGKIGYINDIYFVPSEPKDTPPKSKSYSNKSNSNSSNVWNEYRLKTHWQTNGMDKIEGIYEATTTTYIDIEIPCVNGYGQTICYSTWRLYDSKYKLGLVKLGNNYYLIYLSEYPKGSEKIGGCYCDGSSYEPPPPTTWKVGDIKAVLYKTAINDLFKCDWYLSKESADSDSYISFENYSYFKLIKSGKETLFLKLYPNVDDDIPQHRNKNEKSSGTGFAITSNGLIVTNYHVIEGATTITVRGVNNDFKTTYTARLLISDKNNDLAIIKIEDYRFNSLGTIPYIIKSSAANVGENIFVMGYPLRATMGDEVKLTNGIISSKSGFQGDVTSYQTSAPVQPGNSGGPLFDSKGQLIGVINAKHKGAENASYAVKSIYLINLIRQLDYTPSLQTVNSLSGKALSQQVQLVKNFVYIIEVN